MLENLRASFAANHAMKVANHHGIRMRPQRAAKQVISVRDVRHPIAQRFIDGVLQSLRSRIDLAHFGAQQLHAKDIQLLSPHVFSAHVHDAIESEQGAHGGRRYAVLSGAGLRDDAALAHAPRQEDLSDGVVNFVRTGMKQIFALQIDARSAAFFSQSLGKEKRRGSSGEVMQQSI
jgi:hypothetical protein